MVPFTVRKHAAAVFCFAGLCICWTPAAAQDLALDPYRAMISSSPSPYWGYTYSPYGSALHGAAAVIHAQGDFLIKRIQAEGMREQVRRAKLETRRKVLEQWVWERNFLVEERAKYQALLRQIYIDQSLNSASYTEIVGAGPLNTLLDELIKRPELSQGGSTAVDPACLAHIHITVNGRGNVGLLKEDKLYWPLLLSGSESANDRKKIDQLLARAKERALSNRVHAEELHAILRELRELADQCQKRVAKAARPENDNRAWSPRHNMDAKRFLKDLEGALVVLEKPDVAFYLNPLRGNTVAELVANMKKEGVRFAPATNGCERSYVALHRAFADEVTRLQAR